MHETSFIRLSFPHPLMGTSSGGILCGYMVVLGGRSNAWAPIYWNSLAYVFDGEEAVSKEGFSGGGMVLVVAGHGDSIQHLQIQLEKFIIFVVETFLLIFLVESNNILALFIVFSASLGGGGHAVPVRNFASVELLRRML